MLPEPVPPESVIVGLLFIAVEVSSSNEDGLVVPMPTLPLSLFMKNRGELVPTANKAFPLGVEDATYNDPAIDEVAVVEVEVK